MYNGNELKLSLVEIDGDSVRVSPFTNETHSTVYVDGTIILETIYDKLIKFYREE